MYVCGLFVIALEVEMYQNVIIIDYGGLHTHGSLVVHMVVPRSYI